MVSEAKGRWVFPGDAPQAADLARCVHCGLCVTACPTYELTGREGESPRGRIALARAVNDGLFDVTEAMEGHWDRCLQCRACEAACPSGVAYGRILTKVRAQVSKAPGSRQRSRRWRRFVIRNVVTRPWVLALATTPVRFYLKRPVRFLARALGVTRLAWPLRRLERQLVSGQGAALRRGSRPVQLPEKGGDALLFSGCIMGELFGEVHRATARLLARRGLALEVPRRQVCCGALSAHDGDLDHARKLAKKNIEEFEGDDRPLVVNSAGCGAALKEYPELLSEDGDWAVRAMKFSSRVVDLTEHLHGLNRPVQARLEGRVTYQDPCHLAHAQRITAEPRALIGSIEGCEFVELEGASNCCGAAGMYSVVEPGISGQLRAAKGAAFEVAEPDYVVTANPGCQMQCLAAAADSRGDFKVLHIAELLDLAEAAAADGP